MSTPMLFPQPVAPQTYKMGIDFELLPWRPLDWTTSNKKFLTLSREACRDLPVKSIWSEGPLRRATRLDVSFSRMEFPGKVVIDA
jgi:hypothetical protein